MALVKALAGAGGSGGLAAPVRDLTEALAGNRAAREAAEAEAFRAVLGQFGAEFSGAQGRFAALIDGLNRVPRPALALGTLGLFIYAMAAPEGFAARMAGLALVPEPLWWLLGAIVSFYFGARELHHFRMRMPPVSGAALAEALRHVRQVQGPPDGTAGEAPAAPAGPVARVTGVPGADAPNAALVDWKRRSRQDR
ncbi:holin family protein [Oceanomicrobium pacificus]|uniref:Holin of 3TMs, for gene-transfer release n=1 Tax=Oceanomicrobium pacificus TaxID=2692916 RepID=A0A6B0TZ48_9RHOB|nr:holin family protein [Oceanomicrobium pacificus]MXU66293.1 hypothetical protein [Oceanomicrobium pacificus]